MRAFIHNSDKREEPVLRTSGEAVHCPLVGERLTACRGEGNRKGNASKKHDMHGHI